VSHHPDHYLTDPAAWLYAYLDRHADFVIAHIPSRASKLAVCGALIGAHQPDFSGGPVREVSGLRTHRSTSRSRRTRIDFERRRGGKPSPVPLTGPHRGWVDAFDPHAQPPSPLQQDGHAYVFSMRGSY
jgi:hypothetical protein